MSARNSRQSTSSSFRSSHSISDPNVFSDEFALEPLDIPEISPFDADADVDDEPTPTSTRPLVHHAPRITEPINPDSKILTSMRSLSRSHGSMGHRNAVSPTPTRSVSQISHTRSDLHRSPSTSSHFSTPRAQSPYAGATGPSHPYGMYPQVTRSSSMASASTVRPMERPFLAPTGPEHPYAMYSQNTVPEEDDVSVAQPPIPVGFPSIGQQYLGVPPATGDDIADIVGSDGHVEELPPYSRYADQVAPKPTLPSVCAASVPADSPREMLVSPQAVTSLNSGDDIELNATASTRTGSDSSGSFKEKCKRKSKQKVCCGLPCWFLLVIVGVLLFGVIIGAVIGGVVGGKDRPDVNESAPAYSNTSSATTTVTAFIDGAPLPTDHPIPEVPNGAFNLPLDYNVAESRSCIQDPDYSHAWACMAPAETAGMGITIWGQRRSAELMLDPYPVNGSLNYGAQPPSLEQDKFPLIPSSDLDSSELGDTLFAWTYYDKLTILPEDAFEPDRVNKREHGRHEIMPGHKPWFCWFNETLIEFFIYVNKPVEPLSVTTTASESAPSSPSSSPALSMAMATGDATTPRPSETSSTHLKGPSSWDGPPRSWPSPYPGQNRRNDGGDGYVERRNKGDNYPLLAKIKEKRPPNGDSQPYCEQRQILDDMQIGTLDVDRIMIPQAGWDDFVPGRLMSKRSVDDVNLNQDQDCVCEWMTGSEV